MGLKAQQGVVFRTEASHLDIMKAFLTNKIKLQLRSAPHSERPPRTHDLAELTPSTTSAGKKSSSEAQRSCRRGSFPASSPPLVRVFLFVCLLSRLRGRRVSAEQLIFNERGMRGIPPLPTFGSMVSCMLS